MYTYVLNSVVKISMMFAVYFECYTVILRGTVFVDTLYTLNAVRCPCVRRSVTLGVAPMTS